MNFASQHTENFQKQRKKVKKNHTNTFLGCTGLFKCELEKILLSSAFKHTPKAKYLGLHQMKKL